jgi:hypothetical protein
MSAVSSGFLRRKVTHLRFDSFLVWQPGCGADLFSVPRGQVEEELDENPVACFGVFWGMTIVLAFGTGSRSPRRFAGVRPGRR